MPGYAKERLSRRPGFFAGRAVGLLLLGHDGTKIAAKAPAPMGRDRRKGRGRVRRDYSITSRTGPTPAVSGSFRGPAAAPLGSQAGETPALAWSPHGKHRGSARPSLSHPAVGQPTPAAAA